MRCRNKNQCMAELFKGRYNCQLVHVLRCLSILPSGFLFTLSNSIIDIIDGLGYGFLSRFIFQDFGQF